LRFYELWFLKINLGLKDFFKLAWFFMLLNWGCFLIYIVRLTKLIKLNWLSKSRIYFGNPSIALIFFFLGWKFCTVPRRCADHVNSSHFFFFLFFFSPFVFNIWIVVLNFLFYFTVGSMILSPSYIYIVDFTR